MALGIKLMRQSYNQCGGEVALLPSFWKHWHNPKSQRESPGTGRPLRRTHLQPMGVALWIVQMDHPFWPHDLQVMHLKPFQPPHDREMSSCQVELQSFHVIVHVHLEWNGGCCHGSWPKRSTIYSPHQNSGANFALRDLPLSGKF